ncbi:MAG: RidA family protein [Oscillospiraceae bacterium]|nr:RidA family protein [Oscillospiraceae bacterium]
MINRVETKNAPAAIGPYCQATVFGNLVYTSGQIPLSPETGEIVGDDVKSQTEQVMKNLKALVEDSGSDLSLVLKTTCFITDMAHFADFNDVYALYFADDKPARSTVAVRQLPKNVLVEVEAVAVLKKA